MPARAPQILACELHIGADEAVLVDGYAGESAGRRFGADDSEETAAAISSSAPVRPASAIDSTTCLPSRRTTSVPPRTGALTKVEDRSGAACVRGQWLE